MTWKKKMKRTISDNQELKKKVSEDYRFLLKT